MRNKIFFFSDAHLGSGSDTKRREKELCACLEAVSDKAEAVFLLGDIFDFWFTYREVVPRGYNRLLGKLAEMHDAGIDIHFFLGNHDMWMFDYLQEEIGAVMHSEPCYLKLCGRTVLLGHGDGLDPTDRKYAFIKGVFRNRINQRLFAAVPPAVSFALARRWSEASRKSHYNETTLSKTERADAIFQYCETSWKQQPFDLAVFGHCHRQVCLPLAEGRAQYVNIGNWITERNYVVLSPDGVDLAQWVPDFERPKKN